MCARINQPMVLKEATGKTKYKHTRIRTDYDENWYTNPSITTKTSQLCKCSREKSCHSAIKMIPITEMLTTEDARI